MELLEQLTNILECGYISNLRYQRQLTEKQEKLLKALDERAYSLDEWLDAVKYITGNCDLIVTQKEGKRAILAYYLSEK